MKNLIALLSILFFLESCSKKESNPSPTSNDPITSDSLAKLEIDSIGSITLESAKVFAKVVNEGKSAVVAIGIAWGTNPNPTVFDNKIPSSGFGLGSFSIVMPDLSQGVTYYVRAYAMNGFGTSYSNEVSFKTLINNVPKLKTYEPDTIQVYNANCYGEVTDEALSNVTEKGFCWSTSPNPTTSSSGKISAGSGLGSFRKTITGLSPGTKYYVRAYAINSTATGYGEEKIFTTYPVPNITGSLSASPFSYVIGGITYNFTNISYYFNCTNAGVVPISYGRLSGPAGKVLTYPEDVYDQRVANQFPINSGTYVDYNYDPTNIKLYVKTNIGVFIIN